MSPSVILLQAQLSLHLARVAWWTAFATSPANLARRVKAGGPFSTEHLCRSELIDDAIATAQTHLTNAQATVDALAEALSS